MQTQNHATFENSTMLLAVNEFADTKISGNEITDPKPCLQKSCANIVYMIEDPAFLLANTVELEDTHIFKRLSNIVAKKKKKQII